MQATDANIRRLLCRGIVRSTDYMRKKNSVQCRRTSQLRGRSFFPAVPYREYLTLLLLAGLCICAAFPPNASAAERPSFLFLRGVFLLRQMNPGEHWPPVAVPRSVITHDTTNALALHPDKPFVLGQIAQDLGNIKAKDNLPLAPYYAAHAYEMLGQHAKAAAEMLEYVATATYRPEDHIFLVRNFYNACKYRDVRSAAARWRTLDASCNEQRLEYLWGSYRAEDRHGDAMAAVLTDSCTTWRSQVLYEDSRRKLGNKHEAEAGIHRLAQENPSGSREIYLLWNHLAAQAVYP